MYSVASKKNLASFFRVVVERSNVLRGVDMFECLFGSVQFNRDKAVSDLNSSLHSIEFISNLFFSTLS
jgi:hypothetical protein